MRYTITSSQLNFFRKEGHVEFEDLYTTLEATTLNELLEGAKALKDATRDLQRENPPLLKALQTSRLGQVGAGLFRKQRLRIVFSQYGPYFEGTLPIEEISSMSETCGGCIIDLQSGSTTFYHAQHPIDFSSLATPYLLIVLATDKARYKYQESDPFTHQLKKLGYGFGDLITDDTHPLIAK